MEIKSVAVLGAGAVGSYVIWGLSEKSDITDKKELLIRDAMSDILKQLPLDLN